MTKKILILVIGLALVLSACGGNAGTGGAPVSQTVPAETIESFSPTQSLAGQPTSTPAETGQAVPVKAANCTVVSAAPTPGPTEQSLFPPPGEGDWIQGPDSAKVTITEYSDFM